MKKIFIVLVIPFLSFSCNKNQENNTVQTTGFYSDYYDVNINLKLVDGLGHNLLLSETAGYISENDISVLKKTGDIRSEKGAPFYIQGGGSNKFLCLYLNYPNQDKESTTCVRIGEKEFVFKAVYAVLSTKTTSIDSIMGGGTYISARKVYCDGKLILDKDVKQDTMIVTLKVEK